MAQQWYVRQQGQLTGPYSAKEIKDQALLGSIKPETELCLGSGGAWMKAAKVKELVFAGQAMMTAANTSFEASAVIPLTDEENYPPPPPLPSAGVPYVPVLDSGRYDSGMPIALPASQDAVVEAGSSTPTSNEGITVRQFLAGLGSCAVFGFIAYGRYNRWAFMNQHRQQKAVANAGILQIRWQDVSEEGVKWLTAQERQAIDKLARSSGLDVHLLRLDLRNGGTVPVAFDPKWLKIEFEGKLYSFEAGTKESGLAARTIEPGAVYEAQGVVRLPFSAEFQQVILKYSQPGIVVQEIK